MENISERDDERGSLDTDFIVGVPNMISYSLVLIRGNTSNDP